MSFGRRMAASLFLAILVLPAAAPVVVASTTRADLDSARVWSYSGRAAAAESLAAQVLRQLEAQQPADTLSWVGALELVAEARYQQRLFRDGVAIGHLTRALDLRRRAAPPSTADLLRLRLGLARLFGETGQASLGISVLDSLSDEAARHRVPLDLARGIVHEQGMLFRKLRKPEQALWSFARAESLALLEGPGARPALAAIRSQRGGALLDLSRMEEARTSLEQALGDFEAAVGPRDRALTPTLNLLSTLEYRVGDIGGSMAVLRRALEITEAAHGRDDVRNAPLRHNIGLRLLDLGELAEAERLFDSALALTLPTYGPGNVRTENSRMMRGVARLARRDTLGAAEDLATVERAVAARPELATLAPYSRLWSAWLRALRGDPAVALDSLHVAIERDRTSPAPSLEALANQFEFAHAVMSLLPHGAVPSELMAPLDSVLARTPGSAATAYAKLRLIRAWLKRQAGDNDGAWADALAAQSSEHQRLETNARALSDRRALSFQGSVSQSLDLVVDLAIAGGEARVREAWDRVVRWRGAVAAQMAHRRATMPSDDPRALAAHRAWRQAQQRYAEARVELAGSDDAASRVRLEQLLAESESAEQSYALHLSGRAPVAAVTPSLENVLRARSPGQALVALYEIGAGTPAARVVAFIAPAERERVSGMELGRSRELTAVVEPWLRALQTPPPADREAQAERAARTLGAAVRERLWRPLLAECGPVATLSIVPEGPLVEVPWHALPVGTSRYLVEDGPHIDVLGGEIALLPSASAPGEGLLVLGGPDFSAAPHSPDSMVETRVAMRSVAGCSPRDGLRLSDLPQARAEAKDVAELWAEASGGSRVRLLLGSAATEESFRSGVVGAGVVHLATHGVMWGDSCRPALSTFRGVAGFAPLEARPRADRPRRRQPDPPAAARAPALPGFTVARSATPGRDVWLALAGAEGAWRPRVGREDGLLTAEEVLMLDLRGVEWVVLSACHSAAGEHWPNAGANGMRRAFRLAGAQSLIASQWAVGDRSTREWMSALYRARARGIVAASEAAGEAHRATLSLRREAGRGTHPFWWAAFRATRD